MVVSSGRDHFDRIERARSLGEIAEIVAAQSLDLGFTFHALVQHGGLAGPRDSGLYLQNYPREWTSAYLRRRLFRHDPIHRLANCRPGSFVWRDLPPGILSLREADVMAAGRKAGLGEGFTVALHAYGQPSTSCSFVTASGIALPRHSLLEAEMLARVAFSRIVTLAMGDEARHPSLTPREQDCVLLMAQGKSDWEIGLVLGIAEATVTCYLKTARRRFGVTRRAQLAVMALAYGLLSWDDVLN